jgi:hypothetical protein
MGIHIICPPGRYGGVISGRLDPPIDPSTQMVAIYQQTPAGWKPRRLRIPAARLWSCDLGQDFGESVSRWRAVLAPKDLDPNVTPWAGGAALEADEADASPLTALEALRHDGRLLRGTTLSSDAREQDGLFPFAWWLGFPNEPEPTPGWVGAPLDQLMRSSDSWAVRVGSEIQYAMIQVKAGDLKYFEPGATSELCTLPSDSVHALAFLSPIDVRILKRPRDGLAGVVTGLGCAFDHGRELDDLEAPHDHERLHVVAWASDANDIVTVVEPEACDPSGYWEFQTFPAKARNSVRFTVAITTHGFEPGQTAPTHVGGDIIALTSFHRDVIIPSLGAREGFTGL